MGRGPTKVRSYIVEDVVVCLLEDTMTKAERELVGRRIIACMSGNDIAADTAAQLFVLGGPGGREPRRA